MTKNPFINAFAAALYIAVVVSGIFSLGNFEAKVPGIIAPLTILSLLVLSVLMMAYTFFFYPVQMYLDGQKKEAVTLFTQSIAVFAGIVIVLLCTLLFIVAYL
jgi:hypothetical protein